MIRPLALADFDSVLALVNEPDIRGPLIGSPSFEAVRLQTWLQNSAKDFASGDVGLFGILDDAHALIGLAGFLSLDATRPGRRYLVYAIRSEFRGRGAATSACRSALERAKASGLATVFATVDRENQRSKRVLVKLGFERVGMTIAENGELVLYELHLDRF